MSDDIAARARRRTAAVVAAVAVVGLVALAAVTGLVVLLGHRGSPVSQPAPPGVTTAESPASGPTTAAPPSSGASATSSPAADDLAWTTVAGARLPVSRTAGPRDTAAGRARGFADTALGAALAAAHISVRLCPQVGPDVFEATLREQVVGGDAAALRQHVEDDYEQARAQLGLPYGVPAGRLYSTTRGYRTDLDSPTTATVRLLIEGPGKAGGSVLVALVIQLQWTGDDWALAAPSGGDWNTAASLITDTTGYTPFPDGG